MKALRTFLVCGFILLIAGSVWTRLQRRLETRLAEDAKRHEAEQWERHTAAAAASEQHKREGEQTLSERSLRNRQALESAAGGAAGVVLRDASLDLKSFVKAYAQAVLPQGSTLGLRVDRFTDFDLRVAVPGSATPKEIAESARQLFEGAGRYLSAAHFIQQDALVAEIDREGFESLVRKGSPSLTDWMSELAVSTKPLEDSLPSELNASTSQAVDLNEEDQKIEERHGDPELMKLKKAMRAFELELRRQVEQFGNAFRQFGEAQSLEALRTPSSFAVRGRLLDQMQSALTNAQPYLCEPGKTLDAWLRERSVDALFRAPTVRTFAKQNPAMAEANAMFQNCFAHLRLLKQWLQRLEERRDAWMFLPETQKIQFLDPDLPSQYKQLLEQVDRSQRALSASFETWRQAAKLKESGTATP